MLDSARLDGREQLSALDTVLRLSALHIQSRDAQVAIAGKRQFDQLLKLRIGKELAPADVGGGRRTPLCRLGAQAQARPGDDTAAPKCRRKEARPAPRRGNRYFSEPSSALRNRGGRRGVGEESSCPG